MLNVNREEVGGVRRRFGRRVEYLGGIRRRWEEVRGCTLISITYFDMFWTPYHM